MIQREGAATDDEDIRLALRLVQLKARAAHSFVHRHPLNEDEVPEVKIVLHKQLFAIRPNALQYDDHVESTTLVDRTVCGRAHAARAGHDRSSTRTRS